MLRTRKAGEVVARLSLAKRLNEVFNMLDCCSLRVDSEVLPRDAIGKSALSCFNCLQLYLHVEVDALGYQTQTVRLSRRSGCFGVLAVVVLFYALRLICLSNCCAVSRQYERSRRVEERNLLKRVTKT